MHGIQNYSGDGASRNDDQLYDSAKSPYFDESYELLAAALRFQEALSKFSHKNLSQAKHSLKRSKKNSQNRSESVQKPLATDSEPKSSSKLPTKQLESKPTMKEPEPHQLKKKKIDMGGTSSSGRNWTSDDENGGDYEEGGTSSNGRNWTSDDDEVDGGTYW
jgi:hypothetical protein